METKKSANKNYDRLKLFGAQVLLFFTFIVSLITTFGTIWMILRLRLAKDLQAIQYDDKNGGQLIFNQDLVADTLMPQENLTLNMIHGEQIKILGSLDNQKQASILLEGKSVHMQAKTFSSGSFNDEYSFKLPKKVNTLDVPNGLRNVKVIRAPSSEKIFTLSNNEYPRSDLEIRSPQQLDISGNMGLKFHARQMHIKSSDSIDLDTKEGSISINSRALRLPGIPQESLYFKELLEKLNKSESKFTDSNRVLKNKHHLCISRDDGLVFRSISGRCSIKV